ncbi:hypothetical protein O181_070214 [Austropuccinia psidii MF-1]|uniref:Phosphoglycerate mutase-like protein n=1 Tax=Austropuccinia psidii MF-1 TaxID=1389203 RepID=A0A9Q3I996_9BASI|nr:hypothetical protein [Austropuccinia psidii MF-1]
MNQLKKCRENLHILFILILNSNLSISQINPNHNHNPNPNHNHNPNPNPNQVIFDQNSFPNIHQTGFLGPSSIGKEPSLIYSAHQPQLEDHYPILNPHLNSTYHLDINFNDFKPIKSWGNLSPFHSLHPTNFGIKFAPFVPTGCSIDQVHLLHRHGARYPTSDSSTTKFAKLIQSAKANQTFKAHHQLAFLNDWSYQLGTEILTPFGRSQMFQLGVSYRQKYGFLLSNLTSQFNQSSSINQKKLVFRTTSQDRMYHSAINFAAGFFGLPSESKYHQLITIEQDGYNNSLAAYYACPNSKLPQFIKAGRKAAQKFQKTSLSLAQSRLNSIVSGLQFTTDDIYAMQQICAYETVAFGKSDFCNLFDQQEWKDFEYSNALEFWYSSSFGSPHMSAAIGAGWSEELLARLTKTQPTIAQSSINITLNSNPITFPIDQPIYVDATHDTILSAVFVTLNLTSLAKSGPLPTSHRPQTQSYIVSQTTPFGAQLSAQVLSCPDRSSKSSSSLQKYIRFILNDAIVPLDGMRGCEKDDTFGVCRLDSFTEGLKSRLKEIDYQKICFGKV